MSAGRQLPPGTGPATRRSPAGLSSISQKAIQRLCRVKGGTRVARWLAGFLNRVAFKGEWIAQDREGVWFALNVDSELEWQVLAYGGFDFALLDYLRSVLQPGAVFVDVGANVGCVCLPAANRVGARGRVLAFEADPAVFERLQRNASLNDLPQWRGQALALGRSAGAMTLHRGAGSGAFGQAVGSLYASDWHQGGSTVQVPVDTLDHALEAGAADRVDVIKIDVEGAELDVLKGGLATIQRHQPLLCVEVCEHTYTSAGWCPKDLFDLLAPMGYSFEALDERNPGKTRALQGPQDRDYLTLVARVRQAGPAGPNPEAKESDPLM
jgi:FkbM family methyltransferase